MLDEAFGAVWKTNFGAPRRRHRPTPDDFHTGGEDATVVAVNMLGNGVSVLAGRQGLPGPRVHRRQRAAAEEARRRRLRRAATLARVRLLHGRHAGAGVRAAVSRRRSARHVRVRGGGLRGLQRRVSRGAARRAGGRWISRGEARALARSTLGWGVGYDFYRDEVWRDGGFESLEDFVERSYVGGFARDDPADLRAMVRTWRAAPPAPPGLENIKARVLLAPCDTDACFRVPEVAELAQRISGSRRAPPGVSPTATAPATPSGPAWSPSGVADGPRCHVPRGATERSPVFFFLFHMAARVAGIARAACDGLAPVSKALAPRLCLQAARFAGPRGCNLRNIPRGSRQLVPRPHQNQMARVSSSPEAHGSLIE